MDVKRKRVDTEDENNEIIEEDVVNGNNTITSVPKNVLEAGSRL